MPEYDFRVMKTRMKNAQKRRVSVLWLCRGVGIDPPPVNVYACANVSTSKDSTGVDQEIMLDPAQQNEARKTEPRRGGIEFSPR
jgi:hypothetical protein